MQWSSTILIRYLKCNLQKVQTEDSSCQLGKLLTLTCHIKFHKLVHDKPMTVLVSSANAARKHYDIKGYDTIIQAANVDVAFAPHPQFCMSGHLAGLHHTQIQIIGDNWARVYLMLLEAEEMYTKACRAGFRYAGLDGKTLEELEDLYKALIKIYKRNAESRDLVHELLQAQGGGIRNNQKQ